MMFYAVHTFLSFYFKNLILSESSISFVCRCFMLTGFWVVSTKVSGFRGNHVCFSYILLDKYQKFSLRLSQVDYIESLPNSSAGYACHKAYSLAKMWYKHGHGNDKNLLILGKSLYTMKAVWAILIHMVSCFY